MTPAEFRVALAELGLTQRAFAARAKLALSTVSHWATGKAPIPGLVVWLVEALRYQRALNP